MTIEQWTMTKLSNVHCSMFNCHLTGLPAAAAGPSFPGRPRCGVGNNIDHVLRRQFSDDGFHKVCPFPFATAYLHVIKLADEIAGRTAGDSGNRAESLQVRSVTNGALCRLAGTVGDKGFPFLDAAWRHVCDKAGMRIKHHIRVQCLLRSFHAYNSME